MKPINPYTRLKSQFRDWVNEVLSRKMIGMWYYQKEKLNCAWRLSGLWQRVMAADQLGYDVILKAEEDGLRTYYVKKLPERPYNM